MQGIKSYAFIALSLVFLSALSGQLFSSRTKPYIRLFIVMGLVVSFGIAFFLFSKNWSYVFGVSLLIGLLYSFFESKAASKPNKSIYQIVLQHSKGFLKFNNPFTGFLVYGGSGSGKTVSVGKPLLSEFMRNNFAMFVYDAKENDYTKTAFWLKKELGYPYPIYNIDFRDLSRSYRFNPIAVNLIEDESEVEEIAIIIYNCFAKKAALTEWDDKALGVFKGVAYYLYHYYPECFTIPHILNMLTQNEGKVLLKLLKDDPTCKTYAKSLIDSKDSKATMSSILSTLSGVISGFAANKKWCYILTGNDFEFNLTDPKAPKAFFISNTFKFRNQISPFISLLFVMAMKSVDFGNKIPICAFMDEATTFKVQDLEQYPSELREYLLAMVMLTQSPYKIEKVYGKYDRSILETNLQNKFFLRIDEEKAVETITGVFSKKIEKDKSFTQGTSHSNISTTTRDKEVLRYDRHSFSEMGNGHAVGTATNANIKEFDVKLTPYQGGKLEHNPIVKTVSKKEVEAQYYKIIKEVTY